MRIGSDEGYLQLEELERLVDSKETPNDVRVRATLTVGEFRGAQSQVWLSRPELEGFQFALKAFAKGETSPIRLCAMDPRELTLELFDSEREAECDVVVQLGEHRVDCRRAGTVQLSGGFLLPRNELPEVLRGFEGFLETPG